MINPNTNKEFDQVKFDSLVFIENTQEIKDFMLLLLNNGYKVITAKEGYTYNSFSGKRVENMTTYFYFTKDEKYFGYAQQSNTDFWMPLLSTVRKKTKIYGSGTIIYHRIQGPITLEMAEYVLKLSEKEYKIYNTESYDDTTFGILEYVEVIL